MSALSCVLLFKQPRLSQGTQRVNTSLRCLCAGCTPAAWSSYCICFVQRLPFWPHLCLLRSDFVFLLNHLLFSIFLGPFQVSRHMLPLGTLNYPQIPEGSNLWHAIKWPSERETSWELFPPHQHLHNNSHSFIEWMFICADGSWEEIGYVNSVVFSDTARVSYHQTVKVSEKHCKEKFLSRRGSVEPGPSTARMGLNPSRTPGTPSSKGAVEVGEQTRQIQR